MQSGNPLKITNSELAQVQAIQARIKQLFEKQWANKQLQQQPNFYTNLVRATKFTIARQFDKNKAVQMWSNWIKWYQQFKPNQISVEKQEILHKIHSSGKYRYCGKDKNGCPVLVIRMKYHIKGLATAQENVRYLIYMVEKGVKLSEEAKTNQISVIYDRRDLQNSDDVSKESMKIFMPILNDYYPQLLKSFYVLGANMLYRAFWAVISFFISKRTSEKINMLDDPSKLTNYITEDNLASEYGGKLELQTAGKLE